MADLFGGMYTRTVPMMPQEYMGEYGINCGYTKTTPREWTDREIKWILDMKEKGFTVKEIAESVQRSEVSVQIKMKRIGKTDNTYNEHHVSDKYQCNYAFYTKVNPQTILDLYSGEKSYWKSNTSASVITNDIEQTFDTDYHERAEMLVHKLYYQGNRYDVIDLDSYGSSYECFDLSVKMAVKGLAVTFGEFGHLRWKRLDFVRRYYGINTLEDFTLTNLVGHLQMIGERNKKQLVPIISRKWERTARVWFEIKPMAITEQWEKKEE